MMKSKGWSVRAARNAHAQGGISIVLFLDKHLFTFGVFANNNPACCKYGKYEDVL
jgi:hypothetical protein